MRLVFLILSCVFITYGKSTITNAADFRTIDKLRQQVAKNLGFLQTFVKERERELPAEFASGVDDIKEQYDVLDKKTEDARALTQSSPLLLQLEGSWEALRTESSLFVDTARNTAVGEKTLPLVQFRLDRDDKPAEGWRVGGVKYYLIDLSNIEGAIMDACETKLYPKTYFISETKSSKDYNIPYVNKKAVIERPLAPGQWFFWVLHPDSCKPMMISPKTDIKREPRSDCDPIDVNKKEGCYPVDLTAPDRKPKTAKPTRAKKSRAS